MPGRELAGVLESVNGMAFQPVKAGTYYMAPTDEGAANAIRVTDFAAGQSKDIAKIERRAFMPGQLAISLDRKTFLYSEWEGFVADLMLVENSRSRLKTGVVFLCPAGNLDERIRSYYAASLYVFSSANVHVDHLDRCRQVERSPKRPLGNGAPDRFLKRRASKSVSKSLRPGVPSETTAKSTLTGQWLAIRSTWTQRRLPGNWRTPPQMTRSGNTTRGFTYPGR